MAYWTPQGVVNRGCGRKLFGLFDTSYGLIVTGWYSKIMEENWRTTSTNSNVRVLNGLTGSLVVAIVSTGITGYWIHMLVRDCEGIDRG